MKKKNYKVKTKRIENILLNELEKFKEFKFISNIRVKGAIGVIEFYKLTEKNILWLRSEFIKNKVWVRPLKNVIYFMPPFIINKSELKYLLEITYKILLKWNKKNESY